MGLHIEMLHWRASRQWHPLSPRSWRAATGAEVLVEGFLLAEFVVVGLGEAVGFVAHLLEQPQRLVVAGEADGCGFGLDVDFLLAFGQ